MIELKTEAASHRPGELAHYADFACRITWTRDRDRSLVYITPPLRPGAKADPVPYSHLTWASVVKLVTTVWNEDTAPADEAALARSLVMLLASLGTPWRRDTGPRGNVPQQRVPARDDLAVLARAVAQDGQQRAAEIDWDDPSAMENARLDLGYAVRAEGIPVQPWISHRASSGGQVPSMRRPAKRLRTPRLPKAHQLHPNAVEKRCQRGRQRPDFAPVRDHPPMFAHVR